MDNCIFCKIVNREVPSYVVYEDGNYLVFLDINPAVRGHLLLITKDHHASFEDLPIEVVTGVFTKAQELRPKIKKSLGATHVIMSVVGEDVPHFHIQFIPRYRTDKLISWPTKKLDSAEAGKLVTILKNKLK